MAVYESGKLCDIDFDYKVDEETQPEVEIKEGYEIYSCDFELLNAFSLAGQYDNTIEWTSENASNKVLKFERKVKHHFHSDMSGIAKASGAIVYEFDFKSDNLAGTDLTVQLKDTNAKYTTLCSIKNGALTDGGSKALGTLTENEWASIAVIINYNTRTREIYLNGTKVGTGLSVNAAFGSGSEAGTIRFWCGDLGDTVEVENHKDSFMIDNVRVYQGTKLHDELTEDEVVIEIDYTKSIFADTSHLTKMMAGYISLHTRNGMVYQDGVKTLLKTSPVEMDEKYYVVAEELCEILGVSYTANGASAVINGKSAEVTAKDGKLLVEVNYFFETLLGKCVVADTTAKSYGMVIAGDTAFTFPSAISTSDSVFFARSDLQDLNDYLFFERPDVDEIEEAYKASASYGQHPRIQMTADDVTRIKEEIKTNSLKQEWYTKVIVAADYLVEEDTAALKYELRDGVRLLYVSRDMAEHMYVLGMAYQLTGDTKYVDRAWVDLEAVSNFPDWHPQHDLDPAEMSGAVAIGYDWMYDALTDSQRQVIEKGIYKNCFADVVTAYESSSGVYGSAVLSGINHNIILNGGFAMGAMAFADAYPEVCYYIISGAITASDVMLTEWGPDGAWKEGVTYWELCMDFTVKMLSTLETTFGTCFSLDDCDGLSTAANYMLNLQSDNGSFNYGDASAINFYVPEMFWLSNKYDDPATTSTMLGIDHGKMVDIEDAVHTLIWYDTDIKEGESNLPLDSAYYGEGVATFRDQWTDGVTTFAAIHGGKTRQCHQQLDVGSFVYDYAGIRWAQELGSTPYDTSVTAEYGVTGRRWLLWRSKAEAHNTIVINPTVDGYDQVVEATGYLTRQESDNKGAIAVLDMTESYAVNADSAVRGMFFTDDRTSLVVRDEISLKQDDSTVYWFMNTSTNVEILTDDDGKSYAMLSQAGKQVKLEFVTSGTGTAQLGVGPATRAMLGTKSPINVAASGDSNKYDIEDASTNRIYIKLSGASDDVSITVKLTPVGVSSTSVNDYNVAIADWKIPEGEVAEKPTLEATELVAKVDGREVEFDETNTAIFISVEGKYEEMPPIDVSVNEKYTAKVTTTGTTKDGIATITVSAKENPDVQVTYLINFVEIPVAKTPDGFEGDALQVVNAKASDEPEKNVGNVAWKVLDQDTNTKWTSQGMGNWILLELEEVSEIDEVLLWFTNSHLRSTYFNVSVSEDGENYTIVKEKLTSTILTKEGYEGFDLGGVKAKYIKIGCNGNSVQGTISGWNNIKEVVFTGKVCEKEEIPTPTPTPTPDNNDNGGTNTPESSTGSTESAKADGTATGDNSNLWLWSMLSIMAAAGSIVYGIIYRKKYSK